MAKKKKKISQLFLLAFLGLVAGSLVGEVCERLLKAAELNISLTLEIPLAFDLHTIAISFRPNLGSLVGFMAGITIFFLI